MADTIHVKGLDELQKFMDTLPAKMEANVMRGALRSGMNEVLPAARQNIHLISGELAKDLKVGTRIKGQKVYSILKVKGKHAFVALWLEFTGAMPHDIKPRKAISLFISGLFGKIVHHPGFHPKPFLRPALDSKAQSAVIAAGNYIKNRLATKNGLDTADILVEGDEP